MPEEAEGLVERRPVTVAELVHRLCGFPLDAPVFVSLYRVDDDGVLWADGFNITGVIYHGGDGWVGIGHWAGDHAEEDAVKSDE